MTEIKHVGVLGMKWGHRKAESSGGGGEGGGRRFQAKSLSKNMDGRKVNKLFGKRNRQAMVDWATGKTNAKMFLRNTPILKKKFNSLSAADKTKWEKRTHAAFIAIASLTAASMLYDASRMGR